MTYKEFMGKAKKKGRKTAKRESMCFDKWELIIVNKTLYFECFIVYTVAKFEERIIVQKLCGIKEKNECLEHLFANMTKIVALMNYEPIEKEGGK